MSIPGSTNPLLLFGDPTGGQYQIERSLRFNASDSAFCSRTPASTSTTTTWTWSAWVKRSTLGAKGLFGAFYGNASRYFLLRFSSSDQIDIFGGDYSTSSTTTNVSLVTTSVYRDLSAWMHIVFAYDTTNGTASDRACLYVNGVRVTAFSTATYPGPSSATFVNYNTATHYIGAWWTGSEFFDGYLADIHFIDGQALTPSSFTEVSATTGQLIPKAYTGSYNTNGFHLPFSDNSTTAALGTDTSGNGNTWTVTNMSALSGTVDSAGGAKPVQNTTDAYGLVAGSGARTDALSANLQIALPLYTSITDLSPLAQATTSTTGNTALTFQTSSYKFYGGSMVSTSTGASYGTRVNFNSTISLPSGGWTVEFFAKITNISPNGNSVTVKNSSGAVLDLYHYDSSNSYLIEVYFNGTGSRISGSNTASTYLDWNHYAICYNGSTASLYINGISVGTNSSNIPTQATMFELAGTGWSGNTSYVTDFRIYSSAKYTGNFSIPNRSIAAGNDSLVDTPTSISATDTGVGGEIRGNYATSNPLDNGGQTLANGNLDITGIASNWRGTRGTIGMSSGKWYWEVTISFTNSVSNQSLLGIATNAASISGNYASAGAYGWEYYSNNGNKFNNGSNPGYGDSYTSGDVIGIAFDADSGALTFYKNGSSQGTAYTGLTSGPYFPSFSLYGTSLVSFNAGQRAFAYTAPSGFKALCDTNLGAPLVAKPNTLMDVLTWSGSGGNRSFSFVGL
jgi:hypothetical protein